ncbi:MAG TPA: extracellular solute-binding protein [Geminicoccaceae bacterium]|nr:extracellular solute-binding protein [Geminicoccaceae bacterium]
MLVNRRDALRSSLAAAAALSAGSLLSPGPIRRALAADGTLNFADVGVSDPDGDWSKFTGASGWDVNLVAIGNAPSQVLNVLIAGGGRQTYDLVGIVGGMQKPLVENELVVPLDTGRLKNWERHTNIKRYILDDPAGFGFAGWEDRVYMMPTFIQGDSIGYLPDATGGVVDSYAALFDPRFRGYTAIEDNFTTTGQKTALYLQKSGLASIADPSNMTPEEIRTVVDFLIEKKNEGQFRLIWTSFEQSVNLFVNREVYVQDCWEPMVFAARRQGVQAEYARPKEGYLLWASGPYIVNNPTREPEREEAMYRLLDFMLDDWYGATITLLRGYLTSPGAADYARAHPDEFTPEQAEEVAAIHANVQSKFEIPGTWQQRWPEHVEAYEEEWARFRAA